MSHKHKTKCSELEPTDIASDMPGVMKKAEPIGSPGAGTIFAEGRCQFEKVVSVSKKKMVNFVTTRNLLKLLYVEKTTDKAASARKLASKVLCDEVNRKLYESLTEDLHELFSGLCDGSSDQISYVIDGLERDIANLATMMEKCKANRDEEAQKAKVSEVSKENKNLIEQINETSHDSLHSLEPVSEEQQAAKAGTSERSEEPQGRNYEEICQQLEDSEKSLEVQQELNAKIAKQSVESRARHTFEISKLQEVIQKLKTKATKQNKELLRIKELDRRKMDVLVNVLEDEKQLIRDECDCVKVQLEKARIEMKEQKAEAKRHLEAELWKVKRAAKAAEKRRADSQQTIDQLNEELTEIRSNYELKDKAFVEVLGFVDEKEQELVAERKKFADLQQEVSDSLEKEEAGLERKKWLDEEYAKLEAAQSQFEAACQESAEEKKKLELLVDELKKQSAMKDAALDDLQRRFQEKLELLAKKLEESQSPRKDRATQLESRLEVIQAAAKAQQRRLEDDLGTIRASLDEVSQRNEELLRKISDLEETQKRADELASALREENRKMQSENAEERAGLVNELIATKERLKELTKSPSTPESTKIQVLEDKLKASEARLEDYKRTTSVAVMAVEPPKNALDEMFPHLDPVFRQFVELILHNQNYMYGLFGLFCYALLIHLYILL